MNKDKFNIDEFLNKFDKFTKDPTLEAMEFLLSKFDNPHQKLRIIHVAGTNGKGSVCEMLNNCLINAGFKTGKFVSPHLIKFNDGITINNKEILDDDIKDILIPLSKYIDEYNSCHTIPVKWFEVITSLVFIYFYKNNCDFVVLETGLGGLTDCTNVAKSMVSIITSIGLDHVDILGDTIYKIAENKAGIIKDNSDTIVINNPEILPIFEKVCKDKNSNLHIVDTNNIDNYEKLDNLQKFDYKNFKNIPVNLKGKIQITNACECLECIEILRNKGFNISNQAVCSGLSTVIHPARYETLSTDPEIIFDGGHNENAIENLKNNIRDYYSNKKRLYIISLLETKDFTTIIKQLSDDKDAIFFFTNGNSSRPYVPGKKLCKIAQNYISVNRTFSGSLESAINLSKKLYHDRTIFIVGSFYIYKDVKELLKKS